jgi:hypothetical protein
MTSGAGPADEVPSISLNDKAIQRLTIRSFRSVISVITELTELRSRRASDLGEYRGAIICLGFGDHRQLDF